MIKKIIISLLFLLIILIGGALFAYNKIINFIDTPISVKKDQLIYIPKGTSTLKLSHILEQDKLVKNAQLLPWLLKLKPELGHIKAGTFSLKNINNIGELLKLLNKGKEVQFHVQFIEGKRFKDWRSALENAPHLKQTLKNKSEAEIFTLLKLPENKVSSNYPYNWQNLDGWLYPDTYSYTANSTDLDLLKRSTQHLQKELNKAWQNRDKDLPLKTPYEMLILASIVEKETGLASERPQVASVFINRLKKHMKLQTDPTVIYGMGDKYQGNIRKKDLTTATAYNTYVIDALPPTPIAMVTDSALQAVAHPAKTPYLYFVAKGNGGHQFSRTLNQHNRAVQQYLRWYRNQQKQGK